MHEKLCATLYITVSLSYPQNWYAKTPLGKKRAKAALADEDDLGGGGGKDKKGKKGKKGRK